MMWTAFLDALRKSEIVLYGLVAGAATVVVTVPAMLLLGGLVTYLLDDHVSWYGTGDQWAALVLSAAIYVGIIAGVIVCGLEIRSRLRRKSI
ncbi:MAG: hypothetical protein WAL71_19475 [Terriglobales bacterium]